MKVALGERLFRVFYVMGPDEGMDAWQLFESRAATAEGARSDCRAQGADRTVVDVQPGWPSRLTLAERQMSFHPGAAVWWEDPDRSLSSGPATIHHMPADEDLDEDDVLVLIRADGSSLEALARECH